MTTPTSVFMSGLKKAKNVILAKQTLGATDLIYGMYTQLNFGSNMGEIPPGYTSSHWCVKKKQLSNNTWTKGVRSTNTLKYILVCKCLCLVITTKHLDQKGQNSVYTLLEPG